MFCELFAKIRDTLIFLSSNNNISELFANDCEYALLDILGYF